MAMSSRGVSARDLSTALYRRGITLSPSKIANWRTGRSLPRRSSTLKSVATMEQALRLPEGSLVAPLRSDLLTEQAIARSNITPRIDERFPVNDDHYILSHFTELDSLNWDGEVYREVLEEEIRISEDYRLLTAGVSVVVRYGTNPNPTLHVSYFWEYPNVPEGEDDIGVYNVVGMDVGKTVTTEYPDGIGKTTTMHLPHDLEEGELRQVFYEHKMISQEPLTESVLRGFSWPIQIYTARVIFDDPQPTHVSWDHGFTDEKGIERTVHTRELELLDGVAQTTVESIANATGVFRWRLPKGIK